MAAANGKSCLIRAVRTSQNRWLSRVVSSSRSMDQSHEGEERKAADLERDVWLDAQGFRILRLPNALVMGTTELAVAQIRVASAR